MDGPSAAGSSGAPRPCPPPLRVENLDALESPEYSSVDTPRSPGLGNALAALPTSPSQRKTKSRAAHAFYRSGSFTSRNSLKDSKVKPSRVGGREVLCSSMQQGLTVQLPVVVVIQLAQDVMGSQIRQGLAC